MEIKHTQTLNEETRVQSRSFIPGPGAGPCVGSVTAQWTAASHTSSPAEPQTDAQSARWHGAQPTGHFPARGRSKRDFSSNSLKHARVREVSLKGSCSGAGTTCRRAGETPTWFAYCGLHIVWRAALLSCTPTMSDCSAASPAGSEQAIKRLVKRHRNHYALICKINQNYRNSEGI